MCLSHLEREMLEVSEREGVVGDYQWGLDVGDHQYWDPYDSYWYVGDRTVNESELERSRGLNHGRKAPRRQGNGVQTSLTQTHMAQTAQTWHGDLPVPRMGQTIVQTQKNPYLNGYRNVKNHVSKINSP
ncbi:hypothetical protein BDN70DRAFT_899573 [Pholiota conissans]|uniref:Uncharacterized protein n=1 Tax=Pholiota conissans TaxID=109636 RepID=A0A9P6CU77_9AGAR|nr:hypothetical protein BDN70DRAFT_899573 [Pholiota conissans]